MAVRRPVVEIPDPLVVECYRRMTPQEPLAQAMRILESVRTLIRGAVRDQHPRFTEEEVLRGAARRISHGATERVPR